MPPVERTIYQTQSRMQNFSSDGRESHCMVCHITFSVNVPTCLCRGIATSHCGAFCNNIWETNYYRPLENVESVTTAMELRESLITPIRIPYNVGDTILWGNGSIPYEAPSLGNNMGVVSTDDISAYPPIDNTVFQEAYERVMRGTWGINEIKKVPKQKKTPEERYKDMRKDLGRCLNNNKLGNNLKKIDPIMKPYLELRDEELLKKVLDDTKDIRVVHEMRSWIRDFINSKK